MEEKKFEKPEAILVTFAQEDIIVTSNYDEYDPNGEMGGE